MDAYVDALLREMDHYAREWSAGRTVASIFLGGGTPTTLPVSALETILDRCRNRFALEPDCEITLEANPATISPGFLSQLRNAGYHRISIGVQSFHDDELKLLDRVHSADEVDSTVAMARAEGFDNLSLDLMFALPGHTPERWRESLRRALAKDPEHLSTYNLTVEPGTVFEKLRRGGRLTLPPEDLQLELYQEAIHTLTAAGYRHYEISNFAKPGRECRHNLNYWNNGDFLGLGAGASMGLGGRRSKNFNLPSRYIREVLARGHAVESSESPTPREAMEETLMLGLRLLQGLPIRQFEDRFQTSFQTRFGKTAESLLQKGLITLDNERLALSHRGLFLADSVILEFFA